MEKQNSLPESLQFAVLSGLDLLPIAFLILDQRGRILLANGAARQALQKGRTVIEIDNSLHIQSSLHNKPFRDLVSKIQAGDRTAAGFAVPRPSGKPLSILVVPLAHNNKPGHPAALVFVGDPELTCEPDNALLMRLFGFTPAEAKVASLLMQGKAVEHVAETLQISEHTTRNHLKRLFSKTNTKKQGELVHTLLSSPAFLRPPAVLYDQT